MAIPGNNGSTSVRAELRASERAPTDARRALAPLRERLPPETTRTLALVASELVTNSVRHSDAGENARIELEACVEGDLVRLSVHDAGQRFERPARDPDGEGGWGLQVVDQLVDRWWIECDDGTRVTCELSG